MVAINDEMVVEYKVQFPNVCSTLIDKKVQLNDKVNLLKQVDCNEDEYDQIIIDWVCSTIEFVSNNAKYITLNAADINELLLILNAKLKYHVVTKKRNLILNPNIFEVLTRFFSIPSSVIDNQSLLETWYHLLQNESWKANLTAKSNIASLVYYCENFISQKDIFKGEVILKVIENLLECYLHYIKSQYVSRKVFSLFCNQLLIKLVCFYAIAVEGKDERLSTITSKIDELFALIVCIKEHLQNLKLVLKSPSSSSSVKPETPNKKQKLDEKDADTEKKGKPPKDEIYFDQFFDRFTKAQIDVSSSHLLQGLPKIYETMVKSARSAESSLTRVEEFYLLMKLCECVKLGTDAESMEVLEGLFEVVIKYGVYQNVEDNAIGNVFHNWISEFVQKFIDGCFESNNMELKELTLRILLKVLDINHLVLQPVLPKIWSMCLLGNKDESDELQSVKESFLCELLITYEKLHQLHHLFSSFSVEGSHDGSVITYPKRFLRRYEKSISSLLTVQISSIIELYLQKLKENCAQFQETKNAQILCSADHEAFLFCHLILKNASVIPSNGYMKPELQTLIANVKKVKVAVKEFEECVADEKKICHLSSLTQHGINELGSLLKQFSLLEDSDSDLCGPIVSKEFSAEDPLNNYLKAALCFDQLNDNSPSEDSSKSIVSIYKDACQHVSSSKVSWDQQIFSICSSNYVNALVHLFEDNLATILASDEKDVIACGVDLLWKRSCDQQSTSTLSPALLSLPSFNNLQFQLSLLSSIHRSLQELCDGDSNTEVTALLKEDVPSEEMAEMKKKFTFEEDDVSSGEEADIDLSLCLSILEVIQSLPLVYFTEQNIFTLSIMMLNLCKNMTKSTHFELHFKCLQIVGQILEIYAVGNHSTCHLPLGYMFNSNLKYASQHEMAPDFSNVLVSSCTSAVMVLVKYMSKDDADIPHVCTELLKYFSTETISNFTSTITEEVFAVLWKMVREPTIKSRSELSVYQITSLLSDQLLKIISLKKEGECLKNNWFTVFAHLCQITQHAQVRKGDSSTLKPLEDKLASIFPTVNESINHLMEGNTTCVENKHLSILQFLYSSSNEFTLRLRKGLGREDVDLINILLTNSERASSASIKKIAELVSNIILQADVGTTLSSLLEVLTETLISELKKNEKTHIMEIWNTILSSKWEKEQRIVLWEYLPKVMLTCVHMVKNVNTTDTLLSLLRLLISVVNIGKNSLMSQYVNVIYHAFVILPEKVKELGYNRFVDFFEEIYQLASQLLFQHQSAIFSSLPSYINTVNSVMEILVSCPTKDETNSTDMQKCCERAARLYREMGTHKTIISKYSSFIIARFIRTILFSSLSTSNKKLLEGGIYCIMDTCTDTELSFLNTTLEKADKEYFKVIKNNFEKHHKFTGKA